MVQGSYHFHRLWPSRTELAIAANADVEVRSRLLMFKTGSWSLLDSQVRAHSDAYRSQRSPSHLYSWFLVEVGSGYSFLDMSQVYPCSESSSDLIAVKISKKNMLFQCYLKILTWFCMSTSWYLADGDVLGEFSESKVGIKMEDLILLMGLALPFDCSREDSTSCFSFLVTFFTGCKYCLHVKIDCSNRPICSSQSALLK